MAYATATEIEADFKDTTFNTTSNVKAEDVEQFIVEADSLINSYVGTVYTVPLTTGEGLNLLKLLCRSIVTARVKYILEVKNVKAVEVNQNAVSVLLSPSAVMKILKDIQEKKLALAGGEPLVSGGGFFSENVNCDVEPVMLKGTRQW